MKITDKYKYNIIKKQTLLDFILILSAPSTKLFELAQDYENLPKYLPDQLKNVKIIEKNEKETITEEEIVFSTIIKNKIIQQTKHYQISTNNLKSEIISGPANGTIINITFTDSNNGTQVYVSADLKLSLKAKFLSPIIKKLYKTILSGIFYKMNADALGQKSSV